MAGRIGQAAIEAVALPDDQSARIGQAAVEAAALPDDQFARIGQVSIEAAALPDDQSARVGQVVIEVIVKYSVTPQPSVRSNNEMPNLTADEIITKKHVRSFIQFGGPKPNNALLFSGQDSQYLSIEGVSNPEAGGIDPIWVQDDRFPGKYKMVARTISPPDLASATLRMYEKHGAIPKQLTHINCAFNMYNNVGTCKDLSDFLRGWSDYVMIYSGAIVTDKDLGDRTAFDADEALEDSLSLTLAAVYPIGALNFENEASTAVSAEVYDVVYGSNLQCGECGPQDDGTQRIYALTKIAASQGVENKVVYTIDGGKTWSSVIPVIWQTASAFKAIDVVGDKLVVLGEDMYYYCTLNAITGEPAGATSWQAVDMTSVTSTHTPNDMYVLSPREVFFCADDGYIFKSSEISSGASTLTTLSAATATVDHLYRIHGKDSTIVAVGANGAVIKSLDRGRSFASVTTEPGGLQYRLKSLAVLDSLTYWVGTDQVGVNTVGSMYYTLNGGETTWTQVSLADMDAINSQIYDIVFATDEVGYITMAKANGTAQMFATWDGGERWTKDTPRILNLPTSTSPTPGAVVELNRIATPKGLDPSIMANNVALAGTGFTGNDGYLLIGIAAKL